MSTSSDGGRPPPGKFYIRSTKKVLCSSCGTSYTQKRLAQRCICHRDDLLGLGASSGSRRLQPCSRGSAGSDSITGPQGAAPDGIRSEERESLETAASRAER